MPWLAIALVVGIAVLGPMALCPEVTWSGTVALTCLGAVAGGRRGGRLAIVLAVLVLGASLGAPMQEHSRGHDMCLVQGEVRSVTGRSAVVGTPDAEVRLWFREPPPVPGTVISARTRRSRPDPRLPGEPDGSRSDRRAGRVSRRVVSWVPLGSQLDTVGLPPGLLELQHGDLLWALATGQRRALDEDLVGLMRRTGTAHLLAISGLHIGLVGGLVWGLSALGIRVVRVCLPRRRWPVWAARLAALPGVLAAVAYASSVGWPVSAQRAVIMVTMAALAQVSGRPVRPWTALSLAAMAVLLIDPDRLYGMGFALSFGAVLGILGVTPRIMRLCPLDWSRWLVWVIEGLAVSIGAMAGTLPLTAWWFQTISPLGPVSNLFAGPLIGGVGVPAALIGVHGPAWLAPWALAVGSAAISVAVVVLGWLDVPPWTPAVGPVGAILLVVALVMRRRSALAVGMMTMIFLGGGSVATGDLVVTFLSVGQGDAVFIHLPDGRRWLVDGGPPGSVLLEWLRREGHTELDTVFLTHPDLDHLGGLTSVVDQLSVGRFVTARPPRHDERAYRQVWRRLFERGIPIGDATVELGAMATLLHPRAGWRSVAAESRRPRDNDDSLVLLLEHEGTRILLTGDIEEAAESWLASSLPSVDLIQAPHHGSRTSSSAGLVVATNPTWVVISCGLENRHGHPHPETLAQWRGRRVVRTDRDGTLQVRVTATGFGLWRWRHSQGYVSVHPWVWSPGRLREVVE